jgi:hypothetical protein
LFPYVLKKFFTSAAKSENNAATRMEAMMKDAVRTLISGNARTALEDAAGVIALFVMMVAVLSLPSLV